jgi:hypothetical protein
MKRLLLLTLFFFSVSLFIPKTSQAFDLREALTSESSVITKVQEGIEYFFAFKIENKIAVLEKQAEKRLTLAQNYIDKKNDKKLQGVMQDYLQIKEKQNNLLKKTNDGEVLSTVEEKTVEQQKIMEEIKTKINENGKQNVVKIQEKVVNQVGERVIEVNGKEGQTEFFNKIEHVWAPGTGPGGEAGTSFAPGTSGTGNGGVVVEGGLIQFAPGTSAGGVSGTVFEGGSGQQFAPGTSAGSGNATSDIKTVEVKTGGVSNNEAPVNNSGPNWAPGTSANSPGDTIGPGTVDPGNTPDSETWIAP